MALKLKSVKIRGPQNGKRLWGKTFPQNVCRLPGLQTFAVPENVLTVCWEHGGIYRFYTNVCKHLDKKYVKM